jgi:hypothetical protein
MLLNDGTEWEPEQQDVLKWKKLYPAVNIEIELNKMEGWLDANPRKRKTKVGVKRFVNSWLSRAQDQGGSPDNLPASKITKTRDMTTLDDLTQVFIDSKETEQYFLSTHGQYFKDGVRYEA